jgi:large subunit ribosomal protein L32
LLGPVFLSELLKLSISQKFNIIIYFSEICDIIVDMVVRMRHTRGHTRNRRSHHALKTKNFSNCSNCSAPLAGHTACAKCGYYKGKQVVKVKAKKNK